MKEKEGEEEKKPLLEPHKPDVGYSIDPYKHDLQKPCTVPFSKVAKLVFINPNETVKRKK